MAIYYQHIGRELRNRDGPRSIGTPEGGLKALTLADIEPFLAPVDPVEQTLIRRKVADLAPDGFQVWGIPSGAEQVLKDMGTGDHLLLMDSDHFRYAGRVVHRISVPCWDLSRHIWGEQRFPLIVLLRGELIEYPWAQFVEHFGFDPKYHMRGNTMRLAPARIAGSPSGSEQAFIVRLVASFGVASVDVTGTDWTPREVEAAVGAYFAMLRQELAGQPYVKATYNDQVRQATGRSRGSVEFKFANISSVLDDMGLRWIEGYKPRGHGQVGTIREVIDAYLGDHQGLADRLEEVPAATPQLPSAAANVFTSAPPVSPPAQPGDASAVPKVQKRVRALSDARNRMLGDKGEEWVVDVERQRLKDAGRSDLALKVTHTAKDEGDGAGYDIASWNADGSPRLIEVKTTNGPAETPFYVTANEVRVSAERASDYWLYRVYGFSKEPRIYTLQGALDGDALKLEPTVYRASR